MMPNSDGIFFTKSAANAICCGSCVDNDPADICSAHLFDLWDYMRWQTSLSCEWDN